MCYEWWVATGVNVAAVRTLCSHFVVIHIFWKTLTVLLWFFFFKYVLFGACDVTSSRGSFLCRIYLYTWNFMWNKVIKCTSHVAVVYIDCSDYIVICTSALKLSSLSLSFFFLMCALSSLSFFRMHIVNPSIALLPHG